MRRYRLRAGLSQEELAERAGLSARAISALERGERRRAYPHTIRALAEALALSDDERAALLATVPRGQQAATPNGRRVAELPRPPTPIIGREREEAAIAALLARPEVRLVTLLGPAGVGKTRLALQVAAGWDARGDGAAFVDLAAVRDAEHVPEVIAQSLGAREWSGPGLLAGVAAALRDTPLLLLLDNFEHVTAAAPFVAELLARCPRLNVLVTSRAALGIRGEHEFSLPALAVPQGVVAEKPRSLLDYSAVRLFVERAQAVEPHWNLREEDAGAVAEIVRRLEGLPLSIELAAARSRVLPPLALLARLDDRLGLLTQGASDAPSRQRTLRDAIAWSYDLLAPEEQALFRRLAVFAGGFTLEAAEAVSLSTLDLVSSLLRASLLVAQGDGADPRFTMLETIREFAAERLADAGDMEATRAAHAAYFLAMAEEAEPWLRTHEQRRWLDRLEREIDNLRAALRAYLTAGDAAHGLRLSSALQWFWWDRGYWREGREWLSQFLSLPDPVSSPIRNEALDAASYLASSCGEYELAIALSEESLDIARRASDRVGMAWALAYRAVAHYRGGDIMAARAVGEESLAAFRALALREGMLLAMGYVGLAAQDAGDDASARPLLEEAVILARQIGDRDNLSRALLGLGFMALYNQQDIAAAGDYFTESLAISSELGHPYPLIYSLEGLASIAALETRPRRAFRLAGAAAALRAARQAVPAPQLLAKHQRALATIEDALSPLERDAALTEGRAMSLATAIDYALASED